MNCVKRVHSYLLRSVASLQCLTQTRVGKPLPIRQPIQRLRSEQTVTPRPLTTAVLDARLVVDRRLSPRTVALRGSI